MDCINVELLFYLNYFKIPKYTKRKAKAKKMCF